MTTLLARLAPTLLVLLLPAAAHAHHPGGGTAPQSIADGILSGLAHPVIGLDHLAFVIGAGLLASLTSRPLLAPLAFVAATVAGTLLHLAGLDLPLLEPVIALSVAAAGALALSGRSFGLAVLLPLFVLAGLFHGYAYGEAVIGSRTDAVVSYLAGFALVQFLVAALAATAARALFAARRDHETPGLRIAGGAVAGAGAFILGEQLLAVAGLGG